MGTAEAVGAEDLKCVIVACNTIDPLVLADIELEMLGNAPVIFQRFGPVGLFVEAGHRNITDFQQFGRGEEDHVGGVVVNGIHHAALFDQDGFDSAVLQFDSAGETGGTGAHHQRVAGFGHNRLSISALSRSSSLSSAATFFPPPSAISGRPPPLPPRACAKAPTSLPAWNCFIRSLETAETMETLSSWAEASTITAVPFWLRMVSAAERICWRSIPSTR